MHEEAKQKPDGESALSPARVARRDAWRAALEASAAAVGVAAIVLIAVVVLWRTADRVSREQMRSEMARLASTLTATIDPEQHAKLNDPAMLDTPEYNAAIAALRRAREVTPGVKYMYTAVASEGKVRFVLDAAKPGDNDGDGREDRAGVWEEYDDAEEVIWEALGDGTRAGVATASSEPYTDEWGTFVTGYAPLKFADGRPAGVIAVDVDAKHYLADVAARRRASMLGLLPGGALSLGVGVGAFVLRRRQLRMLRNVESASEEAAEWASMLAESEGRFRSLADASPVLIWTSNTGGDFDYFNRGWLRFTGRTLEQECGRGWIEGLHPDDLIEFMQAYAEAFGARAGFEREFRLRRADGEWRVMMNRGVPRNDAAGNFIGFAGACIDLTEQRRAEAAVRESERHTRLVLDTALDAVVAIDAEGVVTDWNPQAERMFGRSAADAVGREFVDIVMPLNEVPTRPATYFRSLVSGVTESGTKRTEVPVYSAGGKRLLVELSITAVSSGRGEWFSVFMRDISDRKAAELSQQAALRLSTRLARAASVDEAARAVNDSLENMTGFSRSAVLLFDQNAVCRFVGWRGLSDKYRAAVDGHCPWRMGQAEADPITVNDVETDAAWRTYLELFRSEGIRSLTFVPIRTENGVVGKLMLYGQAPGEMTTRVLDSARTAATYLGVAVGRLLAQDRTRKSEELFRLLVENTDDIVDLSSAENRSEYVSPAFTRLTGWRSDDEAGLSLGAYIADQDRATYEGAREKNLAGERTQIECRVKCRDGSELWIDLCSVPVRDSDGSRVTKILHSARDITQRKAFEAELAGARVAAEAASRAKTEFLANMSHEIRTPLTAILGYTDLVLDDPESTGPTVTAKRETVTTIRRAGEHLLTVVNDILDISKIEAGCMTLEKVELALPALLSAVHTLMTPRAEGKGISFATVLDGPVPAKITGDPTRLRQILLNLTGNAVKFTQQGGVTLRVGFQRRDAGGVLTLDVDDTGPGLSAEQASRLFEPFSQADASVTRKHGGTGLGLSISRRLARLLGGDVTIERCSPGCGCCFRLTLAVDVPADAPMITTLEQAQGAAPAKAEGGDQAKLSGRVIVAEDGPDNQRLIRLHLTKAGAGVDVAENGLIALEMIEKAEAEGRPYDLLVTDMQMPEMDGYTLASALRASGSKLAIVALTAHAMAEDRQRCLNAGCDDYASKPIDRRAFLATCGKWIGRPGGTAAAHAA